MYKHFLEHLELREGNIDHVYLDTLGKPTCGVGHLLTEEECKLMWRLGCHENVAAWRAENGIALADWRAANGIAADFDAMQM